MIYTIAERLARLPNDASAPQQNYIEILTGSQFSQRLPKAADLPATLPAFEKAHFCKAEVELECLYGTFCIPEKQSPERKIRFAYILWKDHVLFVENGDYVYQCIEKIRQTKVLAAPTVGSFFYAFLEMVIQNDLPYLEQLEVCISKMENDVLFGSAENFNQRMILSRKRVSSFFHYYTQLTDVGAVLQENEAELFSSAEIKKFRLFTDRVNRLLTETQILREYSMQVHEAYQAQIDIRQNRIMKILTIVTTIFLPLSLIASWYGMNFSHMPELGWRWGYPLVIAVSCICVCVCLWFFKKKKFW